jgi:glucose-6-phosphate 1-dehydrogenase
MSGHSQAHRGVHGPVALPWSVRADTPNSATAEPCVVVIFGASGDLAERKLVPALGNLRRGGLLPDDFLVMGVLRAEKDERELRDALFGHMPGDEANGEIQAWLDERLTFVVGDVDGEDLYRDIATTIDEWADARGVPACAAFYLATPPQAFEPIAKALGHSGLLDEQDDRWRRLIIEKPFGHDLASAQALNAALAEVMHESQVYRIDHYLGKETVQNLMIFRFANAVFEPIWNRRYVDHVQITVAEQDGIGSRGGYYDEAGALRDMVQNHLFMLLALTAMEPPISFEADAVRDERLKVLQAIVPLTSASIERDVVRGQYEAGTVDDREVTGYREEGRVAADSTTETFVAMRLFVETWRWAGVPFYLRTAKRLPRRASEIAVYFKEPPFVMFRDTCVSCLNQNVLVVRVQPDEGISLKFEAKVPGQTLDIRTVHMDFRYDTFFGAKPSTGYETLLYDALQGDQTLFHRADSVEVSWRVVMPLLEHWDKGGEPLPYEAGTWGPEEAHELLERDGRSWRRP